MSFSFGKLDWEATINNYIDVLNHKYKYVSFSAKNGDKVFSIAIKLHTKWFVIKTFRHKNKFDRFDKASIFLKSLGVACFKYDSGGQKDNE